MRPAEVVLLEHGQPTAVQHPCAGGPAERHLGGRIPPLDVVQLAPLVLPAVRVQSLAVQDFVRKAGHEVFALPSSNPAKAMLSFEQKPVLWRGIRG